ncbi:MAG: membrane-binding protein, partial [Bacteroidales bacterium]|jgi:sporulation-control protein spo0M|nr:membrane-binding protein [Bacteroidales bacterium]
LSTTTYDAAAAYQARVLSNNRIAEFNNNQLEVRNAKQKGYLKKNTIYPGETISGYVHIQRVRGVSVYITVNINEANYLYGWIYGK